MNIKRNILHSLFIICAVVCLSLGLAACGDPPWIAAKLESALPTGIYRFSFANTRYNEDGSETDGQEKGKDLKFSVELDVGYGLGDMKFLANGAEVTQKEMLSDINNREFWEFCVPKIESEISLTITGAPEKKLVDVKFEFYAGELADDENVRFDFGERTNMTVAELTDYLSSAVPCKHDEDLAIKVISPDGFDEISLYSSTNHQVVRDSYERSGDNFITTKTLRVDIKEEYTLSLSPIKSAVDLDYSGIYYGNYLVAYFNKITLTKDVEGSSVEVTDFKGMENGMTLTLGVNGYSYDQIDVAKEILNLLKTSQRSDIYFMINNKERIDINNIEISDDGKITIKNVKPVWEYANGDYRFYAYNIMIVGAAKYFKENPSEWVCVTSEDSSFSIEAWNEGVNKIFSGEGTIEYVGPHYYQTAPKENYYKAGNFSVRIVINPFLDGDTATEKTYAFTLCGRKTTVKYTKSEDITVAEKLTADDGLEVTITPAGEGNSDSYKNLAWVTLSITDFNEWTGFSVELAQ